MLHSIKQILCVWLLSCLYKCCHRPYEPFLKGKNGLKAAKHLLSKNVNFLEGKFKPDYLNKAHADSAHLGELINGLKAMVDGLSQQLSELLVVENL